MAFMYLWVRLLRVYHANGLVNDGQWTHIKHAYRVHRSIHIFTFIAAYKPANDGLSYLKLHHIRKSGSS